MLVVFQLPPPDSPAQDARSAYFWLAVARVVLAAALALAMLWPYAGHARPWTLGASLWPYSLGASERSEPGGGREEDPNPNPSPNPNPNPDPDPDPDSNPNPN